MSEPLPHNHGLHTRNHGQDFVFYPGNSGQLRCGTQRMDHWGGWYSRYTRAQPSQIDQLWRWKKKADTQIPLQIATRQTENRFPFQVLAICCCCCTIPCIGKSSFRLFGRTLYTRIVWQRAVMNNCCRASSTYTHMVPCYAAFSLINFQPPTRNSHPYV